MRYHTEPVSSLSQIIRKLGLISAFEKAYERPVEVYQFEHGSYKDVVCTVLEKLNVRFRNVIPQPDGNVTIDVGTLDESDVRQRNPVVHDMSL
jgi:hypothetical protein